MVLHPALVALDGCCHMLGALIVDCDAVALAELLGRIVGQRYGHGQFEDRGQGIGAVEAQEIGQPFLGNWPGTRGRIGGVAEDWS